MRLIILLFIVCAFAGDHELIKKYKLDEVVAPGGYTMNLWVYEIEGCEYIGPANFDNAWFLAHKGNCKYCLERFKSSTPATQLQPTTGGYFSRYGK